MRSVSVVLPESIWAEMPMLRMLHVGDALPFEVAAADFEDDGVAASAAAGIDASPRDDSRSVEEGRAVPHAAGEVDRAANDEERKRRDEGDNEGAAEAEACSMAVSTTIEDELALLLPLLHLRAAASAALAAGARMVILSASSSVFSPSRKRKREENRKKEF
jgi:hypothetical protein